MRYLLFPLFGIFLLGVLLVPDGFSQEDDTTPSCYPFSHQVQRNSTCLTVSTCFPLFDGVQPYCEWNEAYDEMTVISTNESFEPFTFYVNAQDEDHELVYKVGDTGIKYGPMCSVHIPPSNDKPDGDNSVHMLKFDDGEITGMKGWWIGGLTLSPGKHSITCMDPIAYKAEITFLINIVLELPEPPTGVVYQALNSSWGPRMSSFMTCDLNCFIPSTITINTGQTVTWENIDTQFDECPNCSGWNIITHHTATSGSPAYTDVNNPSGIVYGGPSGEFDSGLIMPGSSYTATFYNPGTFDYFCTVHPWMLGTVVVEGTAIVPEPDVDMESIIDVVGGITTGTEVMIETDIVNQQNYSQIFAYIVQIKDESGVVLSVSIINGSLGEGQTLTQAISWTPSDPGVYVAEVYLWDDTDVGNPLSDVEIQYFIIT